MTKQLVLILTGIFLMVSGSTLASIQLPLDPTAATATWLFHVGSICLTAGLAAWAVDLAAIRDLKQELRELRRELELRRAIDFDDEFRERK